MVDEGRPDLMRGDSWRRPSLGQSAYGGITHHGRFGSRPGDQLSDDPRDVTPRAEQRCLAPARGRLGAPDLAHVRPDDGGRSRGDHRPGGDGPPASDAPADGQRAGRLDAVAGWQRAEARGSGSRPRGRGVDRGRGQAPRQDHAHEVVSAGRGPRVRGGHRHHPGQRRRQCRSSTAPGTSSSGWIATDGTTTLLCADDGPGFGEGEIPHAFELGYRGPSQASRVPGTGAGLAGCALLAKWMSAQIDVANLSGGGALVSLTFPATDPGGLSQVRPHPGRTDRSGTDLSVRPAVSAHGPQCLRCGRHGWCHPAWSAGTPRCRAEVPSPPCPRAPRGSRRARCASCCQPSRARAAAR